MLSYIQNHFRFSFIKIKIQMSRTVVLKPEYTKKVSFLLRKILSKEIQQAKQHNYLERVLKKLYKNYQQKMQMTYFEILSCIQKWHIEWFEKSFEWRTNNVMLKICHISFPNLKILTLQKLQIGNVEAISWIDCPCLQTLNLSNNSISTLKSLAKRNNKSLRNLYLQKNMFSCNQFEFFTNRILANKNSIGSLQVGLDFQISTHGILMKANIQKIDQMNFHTQLVTEKVRRKIHRKFM